LQGIAQDLPSVSPKLDRTQALTALMRQQPMLKIGAKPRNQQADLYVHLFEGRARLVYLVSFVIDGDEPSRPTAMIDAFTGELLEQWEGLTTAEGYGPGGNEKTGQYQYGTDFPALNVAQSGTTCTMDSSNVQTHDFNHGTSGPIHSFECPTNTHKAINGAYAPLNDAHHFGGVVYDMYQAYVGGPPLTFKLRMNVHYGTNYQNAFWDGSSMTFGDGGSKGAA
jgi:vibriolysin